MYWSVSESCRHTILEARRLEFQDVGEAAKSTAEQHDHDSNKSVQAFTDGRKQNGFLLPGHEGKALISCHQRLSSRIYLASNVTSNSSNSGNILWMAGTLSETPLRAQPDTSMQSNY